VRNHSTLSSSRLVYSTDSGRICPDCGKALAQCICLSKSQASAAAALAASDGVVRVSRDSKGRGGKSVTVVRGLELDGAALLALGKQLKAACGSGGTVKDGVIEVQGDHVATVVAALQKLGHTVKRSGGP
jgi:translation initiation factor 1